METKNIVLVVIGLVLVFAVGYALMPKDDSYKDDKMMADKDMMDKDMEKEDMMEDEMSEGVMVGGAMMLPTNDIVDNAVNSADHTTLIAAVQAAGLVDTLKSPGPFTVFAPTNIAFAALPEGTVESLLEPENIDQLTSVLTYHVVPGVYTAEDLTDGMTLETVNGQMLTVTYQDGSWMINDAMVEVANAVSSNGITHVINAVLLPQ